MKPLRPLVAVAGAVLALVLTVTPALAAEGITRPEYVARLEKTCKPRSEATERAVRGVRADVRAERFGRAGRKFAKARRIFAATVDSISTVPRPEADRDTLKRWFSALDREEAYLGQMVQALQQENVARLERVSARFIHEGNRANNAVVAFGFNYCSFKPSRFQ